MEGFPEKQKVGKRPISRTGAFCNSVSVREPFKRIAVVEGHSCCFSRELRPSLGFFYVTLASARVIGTPTWRAGQAYHRCTLWDVTRSLPPPTCVYLLRNTPKHSDGQLLCNCMLSSILWVQRRLPAASAGEQKKKRDKESNRKDARLVSAKHQCEPKLLQS